MGPELPVRVAPAGEFGEVARLLGCFRDYYGEDSPSDQEFLDRVSRLIADPDTEYVLAGEPAVGVVQLRYRFSAWTGERDCWVEDVFVEADARDRGVGRTLVRGAIERARSRGCSRVQLDANERNERAIGLYNSLGFESGRPDRFDGGRDLFMTCWL